MSNLRRITVQRASAITIALCGLLGLLEAAVAQVGHRPESSPYNDLRARRVLSFESGYLTGSSGSAKVGPGSGVYGGAKFDLHISGPAALSFGAGVAQLERIIIDPRFGPENRTLDTATQSIILLDAGFDMLLTGEKTWRGLVPYFGAGLGMALGTGVEADSLSGFKFSANFTFGPKIGIWIHPSDRITFRLEAKDIMWQLGYPDGFFTAPEFEPTAPPVLDPNVTKDKQWVHHIGLTLRIGYTLGRL